MTVWRADMRMGLRLTVALLATTALGVPFVLLALLVRARWGPLIRLDTTAADGLHAVALRHPAAVDALQAISTVFDPLVFRLAATYVATWLLLDRRPRLAVWMLTAAWGSALLSGTVKLLVGRARPDLVDAVASAPGRSFPSGHALGSMVGCGVLLLVLGPLLSRGWQWVARAAAVLVVLAVGFARVGLGVHYVTDVLAGWVLGIGWLAVTAAVFEAWRRDVGLPPAPATEVEPELGEGMPEPTSG